VTRGMLAATGLGAMAVTTAGLFGGAPPARAANSPITHIVVLMQENHSFDSELGFWCDQNPTRCAGMPATVKLADGTTVVPGITPDKVPTVDHSVNAQTRALGDDWDHIRGCFASTGYACISGYDPSTIPNLSALASRYTILDHAFSLANAPSWGGHVDELAGTTDGFTGQNPHAAQGVTPGPGWGCDSDKLGTMLPVNGKAVPSQPSCIPDYSLGLPNGGAYEPTVVKHVPTILDKMDTAGVSWKIYALSTATAQKYPNLPPTSYGWSACPSFADCRYTSQDANLVNSNNFFTAASAGKLPNVSFVMPTGNRNNVYSQHNGQSNAAGDNWIGRVVSAVMNGPVGSSSAVIITYDDCGCFYDQVTPPLAPDGRQMGPRMPFVIVSPYANPASTDSTVTSSTGSILAFIEWDFGLPALGVNDGQADNLSTDFNLNQQPLAIPRMVRQKLPASAYRLAWSTAHDPT
jgi:phospholipase C